MFEALFTRRGTIASYRAAPLLDERLRYLRHCSQAGVGRATLRQIAAHQLHLVHFLGLRKAERVGMPRIEAAAAQWLRRSQGRPRGPVRPKTRRGLRRSSATVAALRGSARRTLQGATHPHWRGCGSCGVDA